MNATKFVVVILIGFVCANVIAISQPEGVSKETKLGISDPKTATTNGFGAELGVVIATQINESDSTSANATTPNGRTAGDISGTYVSTGGNVNATGGNANATSASSGAGTSSSIAQASPSSTGASGNTTGSSNTTTTGSTVPTLPSAPEGAG